MDDVLTYTWTTIMKFILLMSLIGIGLFFTKQTPMEDISEAYIQIAAVKGGFTTADITNLKSDMQKAGYDLSKLTIKLEAWDVNGTALAGSKVYPVTPFDQAPYPATPNFVARGGKIVLTIFSDETTTYNEVVKFITGTAGTTKHGIRRVAMSERIK